MSQRGLILALQRFHDDPGFKDMVARDPEGTLGLYDLDDNERQMLMAMDEERMRQLAANVGLDWRADHVSGVGAIDESEASIESGRKPGIEVPHTPSGGVVDSSSPIRPA